MQVLHGEGKACLSTTWGPLPGILPLRPATSPGSHPALARQRTAIGGESMSAESSPARHNDPASSQETGGFQHAMARRGMDHTLGVTARLDRESTCRCRRSAGRLTALAVFEADIAGCGDGLQRGSLVERRLLVGLLHHVPPGIVDATQSGRTVRHPSSAKWGICGCGWRMSQRNFPSPTSRRPAPKAAGPESYPPLESRSRSSPMTSLGG